MATETATVKPYDEMTFEELAKVPRGTILHDAYDEGVRLLVMRGNVSLCAYVGVPETHPIAGQNYNDLPVSAHGGLTYGDKGDDKPHPAGFYWYGWDYAHMGDVAFFDLDEPIKSIKAKHGLSGDLKVKRWTVKDVLSDSWSTVYEFRKLMKLAEEITARAKGWRS